MVRHIPENGIDQSHDTFNMNANIYFLFEHRNCTIDESIIENLQNLHLTLPHSLHNSM